MPDSPPIPHLATCLNCTYDLSALATRTCPECGYAATDEDVELDLRRRIYLEVTSRQHWTIWLLCILLGYWMWSTAWFWLRDWVFAAPIAPLILAAFARAGGWWASRAMPRLHRRIFQRAWFLSSVYWFVAVFILQIVGVFVFRVWAWRDLRNSSFFGSMETQMIWMSIHVCMFLLPLPVWFMSWKRASRLAGVPGSARTRTVARKTTLASTLPLLVLAAIILIVALVYAAGRFLDSQFPGWDLAK